MPAWVIRVGCPLEYVALLYAYVPDPLVLNLSKHYQDILLWLDPDKWDRMLRRVNRYQSLGINVRCIRANQDPKFYSLDEIEEKIN